MVMAVGDGDGDGGCCGWVMVMVVGGWVCQFVQLAGAPR